MITTHVKPCGCVRVEFHDGHAEDHRCKTCRTKQEDHQHEKMDVLLTLVSNVLKGLVTLDHISIRTEPVEITTHDAPRPRATLSAERPDHLHGPCPAEVGRLVTNLGPIKFDVDDVGTVECEVTVKGIWRWKVALWLIWLAGWFAPITVRFAEEDEDGEEAA